MSFFKALILLGAVGLSACPAPGAQTGVNGASPPAAESPGDAPADVSSPSIAVMPGDAVANQPGPGGSMPSGTLAPPPLVPVNISYKAEGTYCRYEGELSRVMIWGKLYRKEWGGQDESESGFVECIESCRNKILKLFSRYEGDDVSEAIPLDQAPDFRFVVAIDDPKQFGLIVAFQQLASLNGEEVAPVPGAFVDVSSFQPYTVDGAPAFCPDRIFMKAPVVKPSLQMKGQP